MLAVFPAQCRLAQYIICPAHPIARPQCLHHPRAAIVGGATANTNNDMLNARIQRMTDPARRFPMTWSSTDRVARAALFQPAGGPPFQ